VSSSIVLIGPSAVLPALRERLTPGADVQGFTDTETLEALDHIVRSKPRIVALDYQFSLTSRGTALIDRIKDDPELQACEVRVVAHDGALSRVAARRKSSRQATVAVDEPKPLLDPRGTRRAERVPIRDGVEVLVDGNTATLVDLSVVGAQVLSAKMLKPNQRVRVTFADGQATIRCNGSIVWAAFEMPKGEPTRYRAGIELTSADAVQMTAFAERYRKK
jgi:archaeosine-15-forming tRNA-guanine transglycosylase